jgi:hypothetical protein
MPNTFLQAWARGVPTVATVDVGVAAHEAVSGIEELARETERAFADASRGARCREHFERHHSQAEVLGRYARVFESL